MALEAIKPYDEMCAVAFDVSRLRYSVRQRSTIAGDDMDYGKSDAIHVLVKIFYHGLTATTNERTKLWCGHAFQNLRSAFPNALDGPRNFPPSILFHAQVGDIVRRSIKLIVDNQEREEHIRRFVFLLLAACLGHGMMDILDDIAMSLESHEYFSSLAGFYERSVIRLGGPGEIDGWEEQEQWATDFLDLDLNPSTPRGRFETVPT